MSENNRKGTFNLRVNAWYNPYYSNLHRARCEVYPFKSAFEPP